MSLPIIDIVEKVILLGGGFAGYASFTYLLRKKFKKEIRVYNISGNYEAEKSNEINLKNRTISLSNIKSTIEVGFLNNSDETVSVTDVVGTLRYNKGLYERNISSKVDFPRIPRALSKRPDNFHEVANFSIEPHKVIKKTIVINFPNMILNLVDRIGIAHFAGFLDGKIPIFTADERELKERWSEHPLDLILSVHIDGKKIIHTSVSLFRKGDRVVSGTLSVVDIERIKQDYQEGKL